MKKIYSYLCSVLLIIILVCSCTSDPGLGRLIPKDALFVASLHVQETVENCELGEATLLKEQLDKSLAHAKMPQPTRERLKEIMEDPQKTGFDFRQPILFFAANSFPNKFGVVGAVSDQDDLEDLFEMMQKEGLCSPVRETDGLRYTAFENIVFAFNDRWFFSTEKTSDEEVVNVLDEIRKLAAQPEEQALQSNKAFKNMLQREGFMHMLYLGSGVSLLMDQLKASEKDIQGLLPRDINIEEIGIVSDAILKKGEFLLSYEILPLSDTAEKWLEQSAAAWYGTLEGNLVNYIPKDAICYGYANIHGTSILKQMKSYPDFAEAVQSDPRMGKILESIVSDFEGDLACWLGNEFTAAGIPEFSFYASTPHGNWLKYMDEFPEDCRKIDDRTYAIDIPDHRYSAYDQAMGQEQNIPIVATAVFGVKRGISYLLFGKSEKMLEAVDNPVEVDKDYTGYIRLNAEQLLNFEIVKQQLGPIGMIPFKKVVGLFDYVECYTQQGRKGTFRVVMNNKEQSPVKTIYDEVEKILQILS